ncbi:hypothetical protein J2W35_004858 [Variovorax boronicumulans]|uniref:hypothetical protein n=1 Tax=Variovorax boronicumulans TaxID=436515 RepID=UPI002784CBA3|nr:hypothetical protein [Variovorax boronicumulans]MDQ0084489.1 hypothetical protein [Variovorax boronicumulans]
MSKTLGVFDVVAQWNSQRDAVSFNCYGRYRRAYANLFGGRHVAEPFRYMMPNLVDVFELRSLENFNQPLSFDALGVLLVRFKANIGGRSEASWRSLIRDGLVHWIDSNPSLSYAHLWMLATLQSVEPALHDLLGPQGIDRCSEVHAEISAKRKSCAAALE